MTALLAPVLPRVAQLVRMFDSPIDGEALGAVRALGRTLKANGASFHDLAARIEHEPVPQIVYRDRPVHRERRERTPRRDSATAPFLKAELEAAIRTGCLTAWETQFATSILAQMTTSRTWRPSPKQEALITALLKKVDLAEACA